MKKRSLAAVAAHPPVRWPQLNIAALARLIILLAFCLGLLSLATVASVQCSEELAYVELVKGARIMLEDGSGLLLAEQPQRKCRFVAAGFSIPIFWSP
jgi:hypothetical protein